MPNSIKTFFQFPPGLIVGFGFMTISLLMSTWATRLPDLKIKLGIGDGDIGFSLLAFSAGSLLITPFSAYLMDRFPTGKVTFWGVLTQTVSFILPFLASDFFSFLMAMFFIGLINGFVNIAINGSAAIIDQKYNRAIMSKCHGLFSIGGIIGAISAGYIADIKISPITHILIVVLIIASIIILFKQTWLSIPTTNLKAPAFVMPSLPILGFFSITFCIVLAEMTIMDWSAVYLSDTLKSASYITGFGFAGFSLAMAIGRFIGDNLVKLLGKKVLIVIGCLTSATGLAIAAITTSSWIATIGFTICGAGMSTIVPIIYSLSSNMKSISPGTGIASIATACILGGLVGRPAVGQIAEHSGMSASMMMAACFALVACIIGLITIKSS